MLLRCVMLVLALALPFVTGCSGQSVLSPDEEALEGPADGSGGDLWCPTQEPKAEAKSWSQLKREFADRPDKDEGWL